MELRNTGALRQQSALFDSSLEGAARWVESIWSRRVISPVLKAYLSSTHEVNKQAIDERKLDPATFKRAGNLPFELPFVSIVPQLVAPSSERGNFFAMRQRGFRIGYLNNRAQEVRERSIPIDVGLSVRFISRSIDEANMFSAIWVENGPVSGFSLAHVMSNNSIQIKLKPDTQVSRGEASFGDPGDFNVIDTTLIVQTYFGDTEVNTTIKKWKLSFNQGASDEEWQPLEVRKATFQERFAQRFGS